MLEVDSRKLLSSLWICVLSYALASPALGQVRCDRGKTRNPKICKGMKRDVHGCCKRQKRKKRKLALNRSNKSSSWLSSWLPMKEFNGVGLKSDYYSSSQGADRSVGIAARTGPLGVIGIGWVGSVNYRFNSRMISGHAGFDTYLLRFGLQFAVAWQVDQGQNRNDFGINYGLKLLLPTSYPIFFTVGGQSYTEAPSEFFINFSIFTSIDG